MQNMTLIDYSWNEATGVASLTYEDENGQEVHAIQSQPTYHLTPNQRRIIDEDNAREDAKEKQRKQKRNAKKEQQRVVAVVQKAVAS